LLNSIIATISTVTGTLNSTHSLLGGIASISAATGTLTVEVDEKTNALYVHWINVDKTALKKMPRDPKYVCGKFPDWARRIAG